MSRRIAVQTELVSLAKDYEFPVVSYAADGTPSVGTAIAKPMQPILCNEVSGSWAIDPRHGRDRLLRQSSWPFALRFKFGQEVLLEDFEDTLANNPPYIAEANVTLILQTKQVDHPVQQDGRTGTQVEYVFQAEEGRK